MVERQDESAMYWTTDRDDTVTKRRQAARVRYMESVAKRDGKLECQALTKMANRWWPGTNPTSFEV